MQSAHSRGQGQASRPGTPRPPSEFHLSYFSELISPGARCCQQTEASEASPTSPSLYASPAGSPCASSALPSCPHADPTDPPSSLSPIATAIGLGPCCSRAAPEDVWAPDILPRIGSFLPPNVISCTLRLVNKEAAAQFAAHTRVLLSQPVQPAVFAAKWAAPGGAACRGLSLKHRQLLVCFAAASGVVENLDIALRVCGCTPTEMMMQEAVWAAAASGAVACLARLRRLLQPDTHYVPRHNNNNNSSSSSDSDDDSDNDGDSGAGGGAPRESGGDEISSRSSSSSSSSGRSPAGSPHIGELSVGSSDHQDREPKGNSKAEAAVLTDAFDAYARRSGAEGEGEADAAVGTVVAPSLLGPLFFAHALIAAAGCGQRTVVELCLRRGVDAWMPMNETMLWHMIRHMVTRWNHRPVLHRSPEAYPCLPAVWAAARGGHVGIMWDLWERFRVKRSDGELEEGAEAWLEAAADGCPLEELEQVAELFEPVFVVQREDPVNSYLASMLTLAAAGSRTRDWAAKLTWLEAKGCLDLTSVCKGALTAPDAVARLEWMQAEPRCWPLLPELVQAAADAENLEALRYLLSKGVRPADGAAVAVVPCWPTHTLPWSCDGRASPLLPDFPPRLDLLEELREAGVAIERGSTTSQAATTNAVEVLAWLLGQNPGPSAYYMLGLAASGGAVDSLRWLREEEDEVLYEHLWERAAEGGSLEALEWLGAVGCPMPRTPRELYLATALAGDLLTLSTLHALGVPFDRPRRNPLRHLRRHAPAAKLFTWAVYHKWFSSGAPLPALKLLLELGAPVDWAKALRAADFRMEYNGRRELRAWLEAEWRRHEGLRAKWGIAVGTWWREHTPQRWW